MVQEYRAEQPTPEQIEALSGPVLLEFGTNWCGYCRGSARFVELELAGSPAVTHLKVEDGPGRPLGRAFGVTLWPTLVFLRNGVEVTRLVRPMAAGPISEALRLAEAG